jgi:hypothetical protein
MEEKRSNCSGPFYYKVLKDGTIRFVESRPNGRHIKEYIETVSNFGQHKWHYLSLMEPVISNGYVSKFECDFESLCGYDRGPRFDNIIRRMWHGKT